MSEPWYKIGKWPRKQTSVELIDLSDLSDAGQTLIWRPSPSEAAMLSGWLRTRRQASLPAPKRESYQRSVTSNSLKERPRSTPTSKPSEATPTEPDENRYLGMLRHIHAVRELEVCEKIEPAPPPHPIYSIIEPIVAPRPAEPIVEPADAIVEHADPIVEHVDLIEEFDESVEPSFDPASLYSRWTRPLQWTARAARRLITTIRLPHRLRKKEPLVAVAIALAVFVLGSLIVSLTDSMPANPETADPVTAVTAPTAPTGKAPITISLEAGKTEIIGSDPRPAQTRARFRHKRLHRRTLIKSKEVDVDAILAVGVDADAILAAGAEAANEVSDEAEISEGEKDDEIEVVDVDVDSLLAQSRSNQPLEYSPPQRLASRPKRKSLIRPVTPAWTR
jgi:hypothetical protein